jgi:acyl-CoA synthetase (AMP-forming)/AMP-acid ligase II
MSEPLSNGSLAFREIVAREPDREALITEGHSDGPLTYAALDARISRAAHVFRQSGGRAGTGVVIAMGNRHEFIVAAYGAMRAGMQAILLNPRTPPEGAEAMLEGLTWSAAVSDPQLAPELSAVLATQGQLLTIADGNDDGRDFATACAEAHEDFAPTHLDASAPAVVFFTSGSSGRPKPIVKTHAHFEMMRSFADPKGPFAAQSFGGAMPHAGVYLVPTPLFHVAGFNTGVTLGLMRGWTGVLLPRFQPARFLASLAFHRCSSVLCLPSQALACLREPELLAALDLSGLRAVRISGGPMPARGLKRLSEALPQAEIVNSFAMTECPVCFGADSGNAPRPATSVGKPAVGVDARLVGPDGSDSERGELWLQSELITQGTKFTPSERQAQFVGDWFRTGDLMTRDADGWFFFQARADDLFDCGGTTMSPAEIERVLFRHPSVSDVVVVPVPDAIMGNVPAAAVILNPDTKATASDLRGFYCARALAESCPRTVRFMTGFPVLGPGKVDRRRVRTLLASEGLGDEPDTDAQRRIVIQDLRDIWCATLSADYVDLDASFFEQGGDSLGVVNVLGEMASAGLTASTAEFLEFDSIRKLSEMLTSR